MWSAQGSVNLGAFALRNAGGCSEIEWEEPAKVIFVQRRPALSALLLDVNRSDINRG